MAQPQGQVSWNVDLAVKPGALEPFRRLTEEMVQVARTEPGVIAYDRHVSADGTTVHVHEAWMDSAAAARHLRLFRERFSVRFSQLVERRSFAVYGNPSDELRRLLTKFGATQFLTRLAGFSTPA